MRQLKRLKSSVGTKLSDTPEFLSGELERFPDDEISTEPIEYEAELDELEDELRRIVDDEDYEEYNGQMDTEEAVAVHRHIDIPPAVAADSRIWDWLAVCEFPWFVRYRWKYNEGEEAAMKKKFWTAGAPLDSMASTFKRLWWIAELTKQDGEYQYTRRAFESRRFVFRIFDIKIGRYKPAALALCDVLYDDSEDEFESNDVINGTVERFRKAGTTLPFEGRSKDELKSLLSDIKDDVKQDQEETE